MINFKKVSFRGFLFIILSIGLLSLLSETLAVVPEQPAVNVSLDLHGTGEVTEVKLPFGYFKKEPGVKYNFTMVHVGGYKVYDISEIAHMFDFQIHGMKEVAVFYHPINNVTVVVTDGKRLIVFNTFLPFALDPEIERSIGQIIKENLDLMAGSSLKAVIYSVRNDATWNKMEITSGKSHDQLIMDVSNMLEDIGFPPDNISKSFWDLRDKSGKLRYEDLSLGKYEHVELFVALNIDGVRKGSLELESIDPFVEDIYGIMEKNITIEEYKYTSTGGVLIKTNVGGEIVDAELSSDYAIPFESLGASLQAKYYCDKWKQQMIYFIKRAYEDDPFAVKMGCYKVPLYKIDTTNSPGDFPIYGFTQRVGLGVHYKAPSEGSLYDSSSSKTSMLNWLFKGGVTATAGYGFFRLGKFLLGIPNFRGGENRHNGDNRRQPRNKNKRIHDGRAGAGAGAGPAVGGGDSGSSAVPIGTPAVLPSINDIQEELEKIYERAITLEQEERGATGSTRDDNFNEIRNYIQRVNEMVRQYGSLILIKLPKLLDYLEALDTQYRQPRKKPVWKY